MAILTQLKSWQLVFDSSGSEEEGSALPRGSERRESDGDNEESLKSQEITWGMWQKGHEYFHTDRMSIVWGVIFANLIEKLHSDSKEES